jgi:hypothetical protein
MSLLSRLFGKSEPKAPEAILHKDYRIYPQPVKEGGVYRIAARIEKDIEGQTKTHTLIRADTRNSEDEAREATVDKAKQAIDQLGDTIFG